MNGRYVIGLDLIRFAAACLVVAVHYRVSYLWMGWVGVHIFFVLSGFVICQSAEHASPKNFFISRFVRIIPAVWICATVTAVVLLIEGIDQHVTRRYLHTLVLWPRPPWIDSVYWTMPIEVMFYALVWLALLWRRLSIETVICSIGLASAMYWILRTVQMLVPMVAMIPLDSFNVMNVTPLGFGCFFGLGGLIYFSVRDGVAPSRLISIVILLIAGSVEILFQAKIFSPKHDDHWWAVAMWLLAVFAIALAASFNDRATWLHGHSRLIRLIGLTTYPLYLLHYAIGVWLVKSGVPPWLSIGAVATAALVMATIVEPAAQKPLRSFLKRTLPGGSSVEWA